MAGTSGTGSGVADAGNGETGRADAVRVQRSRGWTRARRKQFVETLAATCNIARSARAAGMGEADAYALRRRDPAFDRLWTLAIEAGRRLLEERLLAHALGTDGGDGDPGADELDVTGGAPAGEGRAAARPFDPALAIRVLGMNTRPAGSRRRGGPRAVTQGEVDAALMDRLVKLGHRLARQPDAAERARADAAALATLLLRNGEAAGTEAGGAEAGQVRDTVAAPGARP